MILGFVELGRPLMKKPWPTVIYAGIPRGCPALLIKSTFAEEGAIPVVIALHTLLDSREE
jgi:hypothetical protein